MKSLSNSSEELELVSSARRGDIETAKELIDRGVDPNAADMKNAPWGMTPLMLAASEGHVEMIKVLLDSGAKVDLTTPRLHGEGGGESALHFASKQGDVAAIDVLLAHGADINKTASLSGTPLMCAISAQKRPAIKHLLGRGSNPNIASKDHRDTPMHEAAGTGSTEIVKLIGDAGAEVDLPNHVGTTPLMQIAHNYEASMYLLKHGANPNKIGNKGMTCLMSAVLNGNYRLVEELIKRNVDVNVLDFSGKSALDFSIRDKRFKITKLLRSNGALEGLQLKTVKPKRIRHKESEKRVSYRNGSKGWNGT